MRLTIDPIVELSVVHRPNYYLSGDGDSVVAAAQFSMVIIITTKQSSV